MEAGVPYSQPADAGGESYQPGSVEDFDRLYRASYPRLVRTLSAVVGNVAAAEDCVQEAFVRAFRAWPRWKPDAPAEAWLYRIAINVAASNQRYQRLRDVGQLLRRLGQPRAEKDPSEVAERSDLLDALRRLPPRQAAALVLRHYNGYTNREIALSLHVPERTVASRLAAAKNRLRKELGPNGKFELGSSSRPGVLPSE
jgi:RNA polymerase sigma-70 factor, ECF subfamily